MLLPPLKVPPLRSHLLWLRKGEGGRARAWETRAEYSRPRQDAALLATLPPEPTLPRRDRDGIVVHALVQALGDARPPADCCWEKGDGG